MNDIVTMLTRSSYTSYSVELSTQRNFSVDDDTPESVRPDV